jgi:hypothetical protein
VEPVYGQFRRWLLAGAWDVVLEALNEAGGIGQNVVQLIDSIIIRAHQHAAGPLKPSHGLPRYPSNK